MHSPDRIREVANNLELDALFIDTLSAVEILRDCATYLEGPTNQLAARVTIDHERSFVGDERPVTVERGGVTYECAEAELFGNVRVQTKDGWTWIDCDSARIVR